MAVVKINDNKTSVTFIDDNGYQYATSAAYLRSLLAGTMKFPFIKLHMYPNTVPGKYAKSDVFINGKMVPQESVFGTKLENTMGAGDEVDLSASKERAKLREKKSYGVDDNVW